ncbi:Hypothetical predicted protein, partial [Xyrichtys novacula]
RGSEGSYLRSRQGNKEKKTELNCGKRRRKPALSLTGSPEPSDYRKETSRV